MKRYIFGFILFVFVFFLSGCSERGYGNEEINTIPPLGANESFVVIEHIPRTLVAPKSYLSIAFSSYLSQQGDIQKKITVVDTNNSQQVAIEEVEVVENLLYIRPKESFIPRHRYKISIDKSLQDIFANTLAGDFSFELTCTKYFFSDVKAGYTHTIAKSIEGDTFVWGWNIYGQLGDKTTTPRAVALGVFGLQNRNFFQAGNAMSAYIDANGTLEMFGKEVPGGFIKEIQTVSLGGTHGLVIKKDGSLWSFGNNLKGQLGTFGFSSQTQLTQEFTKSLWKRASCGYEFSVAIKQDGTLWGWGANDYGQLGSSSLNLYRLPTQEENNITSWKSVSAKGEHTCGIVADGSLWCFGRNDSGQLGDGSFESNKSKRIKVQHPNALIWQSVSCGFNHTLAIDANNTLWAWGDNYYGELGDGTTQNKNTPVKIADGFKSVQAGKYFSVGLKEDNTLWVWGDNSFFQLGLGEVDGVLRPQEVQ